MAESRIINTETYQGLYPTVFKKIDSSDVSVNPFKAYKSWSIYSGSSTSSALPLNGVYTDINNLPALGSELTYNDLTAMAKAMTKAQDFLNAQGNEEFKDNIIINVFN